MRFSNWTQYIDRASDGTSPTMAAFTALTGISVDYREEIDDNDAFANAITPRLLAGQDIDRDLLVFSDWMVTRLIRNGLLAPLELIRMPHAPLLLEELKDVSFDPGRRYSLAWQSGFAGLGYHRGRVGRDLHAVADLWADDLAGKVALLSEMRDTLGLIMLARGVDISGSFGRAAVEEAAAEVGARIADGHVRHIRGNSYLEDFKAGTAWAGIVWSGDIAALRQETGSDQWRFVLPDTGGTLWSDNVVIPVTSPRRRAAMAVIDYYYRPEVAAKVTESVRYICPVAGAQAVVARSDETLAADPLVFPDAAFLRDHAREFRALTPAEESEYGALWASTTGL